MGSGIFSSITYTLRIISFSQAHARFRWIVGIFLPHAYRAIVISFYKAPRRCRWIVKIS